MTDIEILMGFIVVVVAFVWVGVAKTTKATTNSEANIKFNKTVLPKLLELHGVITKTNGIEVRVLPADIEKAVSAFLNR